MFQRIIFTAIGLVLPSSAFANHTDNWYKVAASRVECVTSQTPEDGDILNITVDGVSIVERKAGQGFVTLDIGAYTTTCRASVQRAREEGKAVFLNLSQSGRGWVKPENGFFYEASTKWWPKCGD